MKLAHIYKARGGKFTLTITTGAAINEGVISERSFDSKADAKAAAKLAGATPHNF